MTMISEERFVVVEDAFRTLREAWFNLYVEMRVQERAWETKEDEHEREERNRTNRILFNEHTEAIINGVELPLYRIIPYCTYDLVRKD